LGLDLKILIKTVPFLLTGERSNAEITETPDSPESHRGAAQSS
jgi:hypothetical protein